MVLRVDAEQSGPSLRMWVQTCSSEMHPKPKTVAESHLSSPKQAQSLSQTSSYCSAEDTVRHSSSFKNQ